MLTLYHHFSNNKCKSFKSMTCDELLTCIRYYDIDQSTIPKMRNKIMKQDLIKTLEFKNGTGIKFHKILIESGNQKIGLYGPSTFESFKKVHSEVYHWKFRHAYDGFVKLEHGRWVGTSIYERHQENLFKMRKVVLFLDMRELYVKLQVLNYYLIRDVIRYSIQLCCHLYDLNCFVLR